MNRPSCNEARAPPRAGSSVSGVTVQVAGTVSGPEPALWEPLSRTGRPLLSGSLPPTPPLSLRQHTSDRLPQPACRHPEAPSSSSPLSPNRTPSANPPLRRQTDPQVEPEENQKVRLGEREKQEEPHRRSLSSLPRVCGPAAGQDSKGRPGRGNGDRMMWIWYLLLGSGSGSRTVESQLLPGNNFTTECNIPGNFMCGDGKCVPGGWQCDGLPDCFDKSDEKGCPKVKSKCAPTFFACANGVHCIIGRFRCNGFSDCPDGSDEENCSNPLVCSEARFKCRNGHCVDRSFLCNGQDNCQDNSDEELCLTTAEAPGQDFVTLDYRLRYYPSITYAVIGSAVIFVLVVALLALVLHHQRKRSVLLPRGVRGSSHHHHQPLLLSRLVILDRGHVHSGGPGLSPGSPTVAGQYRSTPQALQLLSGTLYPSGFSMDSPPSYSQAVLDVSRPPWFDLPPPPYLSDGELPSEGELPQYEGPQEPLSHPTAHPTAPSTPRTAASATQPSSREESNQL